MSATDVPSGATAVGGTETPRSTDPSQASLGELIGNVTKDLSVLMRQEVALAKAELADSAKKAGKGGGMLGGAGVAGHFVLLFRSLALAWAIGDLIDNQIAWGFVIVALLWAVVAAVLASKGRAELKKVEGVPQTTETVAKIPNALKGHEEENR